MDIKRALPGSELRSVVRSFEERRVDLRKRDVNAVAARPHLILNIHLANRIGFASTAARERYTGNGRDRTADLSSRPRLSVGPDLCFQYSVSTDRPQSTGRDQHDVAGQSRIPRPRMFSVNLPRLADCVRAAPDFESRVAAVESWAGDDADKRGPDGAIGLASRRTIATRGAGRGLMALSADPALARASFSVVCGASRHDAKTVRENDPFRQSTDRPSQRPRRPWTDIIHEFGYFDQAHLFANAAPLPVAAERLVGDWDNVFSPSDD